MIFENRVHKLNVYVKQVWRKNNNLYDVQNFPHLAILTLKSRRATFPEMANVIKLLSEEVSKMLLDVHKLENLEDRETAYEFLLIENFFLLLGKFVLEDIVDQPLSLCDMKTVKLAASISKVNREDMYKSAAKVFMNQACIKFFRLQMLIDTTSEVRTLRKCGISVHSWKLDYAYFFQFSLYRYVDLCVSVANSSSLFSNFFELARNFFKVEFPESFALLDKASILSTFNKPNFQHIMHIHPNLSSP